MARSSSVSRIERAYDDLRAVFKDARKTIGREGLVLYGPELCGAVSHFHRELLQTTGQDEIKRRAGLIAERTGKGSRHSEVTASLLAAGIGKDVPISRPSMPPYYFLEAVRSQLDAVRRLLGPAGHEKMTPRQQNA